VLRADARLVVAMLLLRFLMVAEKRQTPRLPEQPGRLGGADDAVDQ